MEALYYLFYGINKREAFIIITGDAGTGKTILSKAFSSYLDTSIKTAFFFHPIISDLEFLQKVNQQFGIVIEDSQSKSIKDYFEALNHFLVENFKHGGKAVLVIDEAQSLSYNVLEQIRKLSNLEIRKKKLIQIVLVGLPELKDVLAVPPLKLFDKRINVYYDLKSLDIKGLKGYVEHRLLMVGSEANPLFTNQAFKRIYSYTQGNPTQINAVCDLALLIAYRERKNKISKNIVGKAIKKLQGDLSLGLENIDRSWKKFAPITIMLLLIFMFAGFYGFGQKENILKTFSLKKNKVVLEIDNERNNQIGTMTQKNKVSIPIQRESSKPKLIKPTINNQTSNIENFSTKVESKNKIFSIQIGAFLSKKNAENLTESLQKKDYTPYIFEISDYVGRKWYSVRMMRFSDLKDAYITAAEFKKKERMPAIVTAINSLKPIRPGTEEVEKVSKISLRK